METNTGIHDIGLISGIPEVEDIQKSKLYKELVEDCGESEFITVAVRSFHYGEREPEDVTVEELKWLKFQPEFLKSKVVTCLQTASLVIIYPDQGIQLNM